MSELASELWVIDLDRTLLDTEKVLESFIESCTQRYHVSEKDLRSAKSSTESSGGSFDLTGYLGTIGLRSIDLDAICDDFIENGPATDLLFPDSKPLLAELDAQEIPNMILTYGSEDWQTVKLRACRLDTRPYLITDNKSKGKVINSWINVDGFEVQPNNGNKITARTVKLVDDKAGSFYGLTNKASGYLIVRNSEQLLPSQVGEVPSNISICSDLETLTSLIASRSQE